MNTIHEKLGIGIWMISLRLRSTKRNIDILSYIIIISILYLTVMA